MEINHDKVNAAKAATLDFNNTQVQTIRNYKWQITDILSVVGAIADTENEDSADVKAMSMVFDVLANDQRCQEKAYTATIQAASLSAEEHAIFHVWCVNQTIVTSSQLGHALQESMKDFNVSPETIVSSLGLTE